MSRVEAAAATDRLPWLPDEPKPKPVKRRGGNLAIWAAGSIVLVAAGAFWAGVISVQPPASSSDRQVKSTTVRLPEPSREIPEVRIEAQPEVHLAPAPQVRSAPTREVRIAAPPVQEQGAHETATSSRAAEATSQGASVEQPSAAAPPAVAQPTSDFVLPRPWPPRVIAGAAGRLVQIGAFGSTHQAKRGWWFMIRAYPAVAHLPAVVTTTRNSRGRTFYRFQVGTTSQAHSEVLCQRMQKIHLSCAVVGLPWKSKVER